MAPALGARHDGPSDVSWVEAIAQMGLALTNPLTFGDEVHLWYGINIPLGTVPATILYGCMVAQPDQLWYTVGRSHNQQVCALNACLGDL